MEIKVIRDSACELTDDKIQKRVEAIPHLVMRLAERPFYHCGGEFDSYADIFGFGPYFLGQYDEEDNLTLTAADEPGDWICYVVDSVRISAYGPDLRVVDVIMYVVPLHDSDARFGRAVYEMTTRLENVA